MLPPLNNFRIDISPVFFRTNIVTKYDKYLFNRNYPIKSFEGYFHETIQSFDIPGIDLKTLLVESLPNMRGNDGNPTSVNISYPGTSNENDIITASVLTITLTNTLLNFAYCYEMLHKYYKRKRDINQFFVTITIKDSADIPMLRFHLGGCFLSSIPPLSFAYNGSFNESKTIDIGITFNDFDVELLIPEFEMKDLNTK